MRGWSDLDKITILLILAVPLPKEATYTVQCSQLTDECVNLVIKNAVLTSTGVQYIATRSVCRVAAGLQCKPTSASTLVRTYAA